MEIAQFFMVDVKLGIGKQSKSQERDQIVELGTDRHRTGGLKGIAKNE